MVLGSTVSLSDAADPKQNLCGLVTCLGTLYHVEICGFHGGQGGDVLGFGAL
jgi:hypothetical protein